jgi:DNA invertase Pin-like site-specific DNA recombinase
MFEDEEVTLLRTRELELSKKRLLELETRKEERLFARSVAEEHYRNLSEGTIKKWPGKPKPKLLSDEQITEAIAMYEKGMTFTQIARKYNVSRSTISKGYYRRFPKAIKG